MTQLLKTKPSDPTENPSENKQVATETKESDSSHVYSLPHGSVYIKNQEIKKFIETNSKEISQNNLSIELIKLNSEKIIFLISVRGSENCIKLIKKELIFFADICYKKLQIHPSFNLDSKSYDLILNQWYLVKTNNVITPLFLVNEMEIGNYGSVHLRKLFEIKAVKDNENNMQYFMIFEFSDKIEEIENFYSQLRIKSIGEKDNLSDICTENFIRRLCNMNQIDFENKYYRFPTNKLGKKPDSNSCNIFLIETIIVGVFVSFGLLILFYETLLFEKVKDIKKNNAEYCKTLMAEEIDQFTQTIRDKDDLIAKYAAERYELEKNTIILNLPSGKQLTFLPPAAITLVFGCCITCLVAGFLFNDPNDFKKEKPANKTYAHVENQLGKKSYKFKPKLQGSNLQNKYPNFAKSNHRRKHD